MAQAEQITLYTHVYSPNCHRVTLALEEAKVEYTAYTLNVMNKPEWFAAKVNPVGKIPAITYGGTKAEPDQPSSESIKIPESLVILEFLADTFPDAGLLPKEPVLRAKARLFINLFETKVLDGFKGFFWMGEPASKLIDALDALQNMLPAKDGYAVGPKWCIADMAVAPFLVRIEMLMKHDLGVYAAGEGKKALEILHGGKFARYNHYLEDIKAQASFKATWDEATQVAIWSSNPAFKHN